jgi:hypothetical protein
MLQICFEIYLMLSLPAALLLWVSLAASRTDEVERGDDQQRFYRIAWALSNLKNARSRIGYDLLEDTVSA